MKEQKNITFRIEKDLHNKLKIKLIKEGVSMSDLLRNFIKNFVEDKKDKLKR